MALVRVKICRNEIEAVAVKGFLENEGIGKVIIKADVSNYAGRIDGVPTINAVPQIILVPEEEAEKAKELLENLDANNKS
ncbi:hypothetical protein A3H65_00835 [Candidatus Giovannonibacteria bacterium RIFCSPLOWO2_02_FULL_45_14]|uniref:DUF2007 domain-containing protein n=1 Tax=Candidatus Giovannonibacteria bacterium RIFCSPLOWO2_12_FULL_44_15 TaxID=1798364 RepID=A0A1F5XZ54_9BACT|nr:MAG: hypothetical protein A3C75_02105 [Candidatus Giovannonibacteria bacterium RIFCSPHIGHO2_02_FULL_44_31]OGF77106.1 MAG: hypothetical protein A3E62_01605 [Candidatus Giovannonibacteria bacterium RIFCSPHIGHO2_12_FULL_44_29]OGF91316.1 MAG: hypothetical protein A3H65_00835 [Candidatus Giovannonibacteria bacterium RIFCSPLOWO2_02_FULL_45_14]OGF93139.1 MAG: hypothetical protein A3G54_03175 [Candidatus Giovannonibacteria bacterium RIFCSPLOWO2_12_FULL_44_15]